MGADCCGHGASFEGVSPDYKRGLWAVIAINASMFLIEMGAGAVAGSLAHSPRPRDPATADYSGRSASLMVCGG